MLNVVCNGTPITDQNMSGATMATKVVKKVNARVRFLYRVSKYLDVKTLKLLAAALVQSHFDYGSAAWYSGISNHWKSKLQICQNKLIRVVLKLHPQCHIDVNHFSCLNWLPVCQRVSYIKACHIRRILSGSAPSYMLNNVIYSYNIHSHNTRSNGASLVLPHFRTKLGQNSFIYSAVSIWNNLNSSVQSCDDLNRFKSKCKSCLFQKFISDSAGQFQYY